MLQRRQPHHAHGDAAHERRPGGRTVKAGTENHEVVAQCAGAPADGRSHQGEFRDYDHGRDSMCPVGGIPDEPAGSRRGRSSVQTPVNAQSDNRVNRRRSAVTSTNRARRTSVFGRAFFRHVGAVATSEREIVVDLAGLEFIDSSGVRALARTRRRARHAGGDLLLAGPWQQVLRGSHPHSHDRCLLHPCMRGRGDQQRQPVPVTCRDGKQQRLKWPAGWLAGGCLVARKAV